MSTTCPACGVAVVPGYVRCPKCQAPLPKKRGITVAGGTAVAGSGGLPIVPIIAVGAVVLVVILYFALSKSPPKKVEPKQEEDTTEEPTDDTADQNAVNPVPVPDDNNRPTGNKADPDATAQDLERALRRQRLWSTVEVVDKTVEVRSGSCRDEQMMPMVNAARRALHDVGLTRLRCVEQSGAVVFEREL